MSTEFKKIGAVAGGAFIGGAAMKLTKKTDGTSNPIGSIGATALGVYLASKSKSDVLKNIGLGMAAVGAVGIVGNIASKVPALGKFAPSINGLSGELYQDENGNIIELGGINGPQFVQVENGQTYMIEGLDGDDLDDLVGLDDDELSDLTGLGELKDLV